MSQESKTTTDHDAIRRWAEDRGGHPATVKATHEGDDVGIIRIAFDDGKEELEAISWDDLFQKFEDQKLAFLYQEETKSGGTSRFFKFVKR